MDIFILVDSAPGTQDFVPTQSCFVVVQTGKAFCGTRTYSIDLCDVSKKSVPEDMFQV